MTWRWRDAGTEQGRCKEALCMPYSPTPLLHCDCCCHEGPFGSHVQCHSPDPTNLTKEHLLVPACRSVSCNRENPPRPTCRYYSQLAQSPSIQLHTKYNKIVTMLRENIIIYSFGKFTDQQLLFRNLQLVSLPHRVLQLCCKHQQTLPLA